MEKYVMSGGGESKGMGVPSDVGYCFTQGDGQGGPQTQRR